MYKNKPDLHEIVFVKLSEKTTDDNYVELVDYDDTDGLILKTEITKYYDNIKRVIKNKDDIFPVIVLDKNNGYDLSYSKIKDDSRKLLKSCHESAIMIYRLILTIAEELELEEDIIDDLVNTNISPLLYEDCINSNKNLFEETYNKILIDGTQLFNDTDTTYDDELIRQFNYEIQKRIIKNPYIINKEFKLLIFENNSLDILKKVLNKFSEFCTIECKSSPIYYYIINVLDLSELDDIIETTNHQINNILSDYHVSFEPKENYEVIKKGEILFS